MTWRSVGVVALVAVCLVGIVAAGLIYRPELPAVDGRKAVHADPALIRKGAELAALGNCNTCHTAPDGRTYAGGLAIPTPFGTIYSTNITPDDETGIGNWSEAAFKRAMREGVDRHGHHLYPVFPYDHFRLVSDQDIGALYAFLMTRQPVHAAAKPNALPFALSIRPILAGWKLLFLSSEPFTPDPARDAPWNHGAYLVNGIAHCGACHTPRNIFGAEKRQHRFDGGEAEGWYAPPLNVNAAPVPWDVESLYVYLRQGWHSTHGVAAGPMAPVADNLATVPDSDVRAIATYVASLMGPGKPPPLVGEGGSGDALGRKPQSAGSQTVSSAASSDGGDAIYASACASCHDSGRPLPYGGLRLSLSPVISSDDPRDFINIVLNGLPARDGRSGPIMPGFAAALTDDQVKTLAAYLRTQVVRKPAWSDLGQQLSSIRRDVDSVALAGDQSVAAHASNR